MDPSLFVGLLFFALIIWFGGTWIFQVATGEWRRAYKRGYDSVMQPYIAERIAKGAKPWGGTFAGSTFGGAYFLDTQQLLKRGLATPVDRHLTQYPFLGGHVTERGKVQTTGNVHYPHDGHLMTVAPTRAGKGVSHIVPNLLLYEGSVIVMDIKGENVAATGKWREANVGKKVVFQPFGRNGTARFNPFDFIRRGADAWDDAQLIAEMIVPPSLKSDDFWDDEARNFVAGVILHVSTYKETRRRNLAEVRRILTLGDASFLDVIDEMQRSTVRTVLRLADHYLSMEEKVKANVRTTAKSKTHFLDSEALERAMGRSDWRFEDLKHKPMSVYIVIPPERLGTYWPLLRLMVGLATAALGRHKARPKVPVMFMLDEFPQLGRMDRLVKDMRWIAEYGVKYWIFTQDIPSLKMIYGEDGAKALFANCGCRIFFGTCDFETAKDVSNNCGEMAVIHEHSGVTKSGTFDKSESSSMQFSSRPLMAPEEVLQLDRELQLIFIQGERPILSVKTPYYDDPLFGPRASKGGFRAA